MISFKTVIKKKKLSNGKYPIYLRATKNRKSILFKTPFDSISDHWNIDRGIFNKKEANHFQKNRFLFQIQESAMKLYCDLELEYKEVSLDSFEKHFRVKDNPEHKEVFEFWEEIIDEMMVAGRMGNAKVYSDCKKSLQSFLGKNSKLKFRDIDPTLLNKYEVFLRSNGGTDGGLSVKLRTVRALYNKALERGIFEVDKHPFSIYKISKFKGKGFKRALSFEEVQRIQNLDLIERPDLVNAKNYFMFSFYTRGMNFADLMKLKWSDVSENRLRYIRSKTRKPFSVKIVPPVAEILGYYRENSIGTDYVFPILLRNGLTPYQIDNRKKKTLAQYNKALKEIASLAGISQNVSSYVARHSYANCLKQKGVATDIIGESLGHRDIKTTQAYLKELGNSIVDEAVAVLLR